MAIPDQFITVVSCIDGRIIVPLVSWLTTNFPGYNPDLLTEPGADGLLSEKKDWMYRDRKPTIAGILTSNAHQHLINTIKFSIEKHQSECLIIVGHIGHNGSVQGCGGNPGDEKQHDQDLLECVRLLKDKGMELPMMAILVRVTKERAFVQVHYKDEEVPQPSKKNLIRTGVA